jgi:hypothetical protein
MPFARDVVVMFGGGVTMAVEDADFVLSATEVAVIDTVRLEETGVGAL